MPSNAPVVDRCVCTEMTFKELKCLKEKRCLDFQGLVDATGCCSMCATCEPYVRLMMRTGETRFGVLSSKEAREAMRG